MSKVWGVDLAVRNAKVVGEFLLLVLIGVAARRVALAGNYKKEELGGLGCHEMYGTKARRRRGSQC